jgi:hypothetical protein
MPECKFACSCVDKNCLMTHRISFSQRQKVKKLIHEKSHLFYVRTNDNIYDIHLNNLAFIQSRISMKSMDRIKRFLNEKMN